MNALNLKKLTRRFYLQDVHTVARNLPGKIFVRLFNGIYLTGMIVEVEAYAGEGDEASHSFGGIKNRNRVMFMEGGALYVYFTYGAHYCCNVVTSEQGIGSAVLIRAVEPINGLDVISGNRYGRSPASEKELRNLTNGPGKVAQAFALGREDNGKLLTGDEIFIVQGRRVKDSELTITKRIGISRSKDLPWRYYITGNPFVSPAVPK